MSGTQKSGLERIVEGLGMLAEAPRKEIADSLTGHDQMVLRRGTRPLSGDGREGAGNAALTHARRAIREAAPDVSDADITAIAKAILGLATDTRPLGKK
jgi:hypothetical protein